MSTAQAVQYDQVPYFTALSGGTGGANLIRELKFYGRVSAVINMSDNGGSSDRLMQEYGGLPVGDLRQGLAALALDEEKAVWFNRRPEGGHPRGNLWLKRREIKYGIDEALSLAHDFLSVQGEVIPVTKDRHTLVLNDRDKITRGEFTIGHLRGISDAARLSHEPPTTVHPAARAAIKDADMIVIAAGNLYGSILPIFAVDGLQKAIAESSAHKTLISNLFTKPGQTDNWDPVKYYDKIESYIGKDSIDAVIYNNARISKAMLTFVDEGEAPVLYDERHFTGLAATFIGAPLVAGTIRELGTNTEIPRTRILHDARMAASLLFQLCSGEPQTMANR